VRYFQNSLFAPPHQHQEASVGQNYQARFKNIRSIYARFERSRPDSEIEFSVEIVTA
jgi:hypothetical protein